MPMETFTRSRTAAPIAARSCVNERGEAKEIACVYHNWTYDLKGNLTGVAFRRGIGGKGGMSPDSHPEEHAPRQLRVESLSGLVFGTVGKNVAPLETFIGANIVPNIRRVMRKPVKLLGGYSQMLPSNWKLYMENTKDSYHASLLHMFFTTFRLNRLSQKGGLVVSETGANHISYSMAADTAGKEYEQAGMRTAHDEFALEVPEILKSVDEFGDGIGLQICPCFRASSCSRSATASRCAALCRSVSTAPSWCGPCSALRTMTRQW